MSSLDDRQPGSGYWRSLQEYAGTEEFKALCRGEFPEGADRAPDALSRRGFLKIMGASVALACNGHEATAAAPVDAATLASWIEKKETKVFHAATRGRGSEVDSTVSSMSLMIPRRWVALMMTTSAATSSASGEEMRRGPFRLPVLGSSPLTCPQLPKNRVRR